MRILASARDLAKTHGYHQEQDAYKSRIKLQQVRWARNKKKEWLNEEHSFELFQGDHSVGMRCRMTGAKALAKNRDYEDKFIRQPEGGPRLMRWRLAKP